MYSKHKLIDQNGGFSGSQILCLQGFERFYNSAKRDIRLSKESEASQENIYMIDRLEKETGGNPLTHLAKYYNISPYSFTDTTQTEIKKIINIPLRIPTQQIGG
ncbi:MAG: hypothetical protein IPK25_02345 [Saprospiraceae bacterium]|nr:hypothetical protein [Saprospiraceae bacterium]